MTRSSLKLVLAVLALACAGCGDDPLAPRGLEPFELASGLDVAIPKVTPETLVYASVVRDSAGAGVRRTDALGEFTDALDGFEDPREAPRSSIYSPTTRVGFEDGYAWSLGQHGYTGNRGFVKTEGTISLRGQTLGSQSAQRDEYFPFLVDFGRPKSIGASARIYSDQACDLAVNGRSEHAAWWEFFLGTGVATWGRSGRTSQAEPKHQQACEVAPAGGSGETAGSQTFTCYYLVTYDLVTREVYDVEFLYCEEASGGFF